MTIMNNSLFVAMAIFCTALCPACAEGWETEAPVDSNAEEGEPTEEPETDTPPEIKLSTVDGKGSEELTASCHGFLCLAGQKVDRHIHFVVPSGYRRHAFSKSVDPSMSAGGSVKWANQDPHDGTIHLHAWADAISNCTVKVWEVTAIKE